MSLSRPHTFTLGFANKKKETGGEAWEPTCPVTPLRLKPLSIRQHASSSPSKFIAHNTENYQPTATIVVRDGTARIPTSSGVLIKRTCSNFNYVYSLSTYVSTLFSCLAKTMDTLLQPLSIETIETFSIYHCINPV